MSRRDSYREVYEDLITGSLFKQPYFRKAKPMTNGWTKRFFVFNRKNMVLQYWPAEEERWYSCEGSVRIRPRGNILLLSGQLSVEKGPTERSLFGPNRFPIIISNGPTFNGKKLVIAAAKEADQTKWYNALTSALAMLKQKQEVETLVTDVISAPDHPEYNTLDNLHKVMIKSEAALLEDECKRKRLETLEKLADVKSNLKYEHSVRLAKVHREEEDKLYAINLKIAAPKFYYKYIITPTEHTDGHGWKRAEDVHPEDNKLYSEDYIYSRWFVNKKQVSALDDLTPDLGREHDIPEPVKPVDDFISYDVRQLAEPGDVDIMSLREMEVFNLLKRKDKIKAAKLKNDFLDGVDYTKEAKRSWGNEIIYDGDTGTEVPPPPPSDGGSDSAEEMVYLPS